MIVYMYIILKSSQDGLVMHFLAKQIDRFATMSRSSTGIFGRLQFG